MALFRNSQPEEAHPPGGAPNLPVCLVGPAGSGQGTRRSQWTTRGRWTGEEGGQTGKANMLRQTEWGREGRLWTRGTCRWRNGPRPAGDIDITIWFSPRSAEVEQFRSLLPVFVVCVQIHHQNIVSLKYCPIHENPWTSSRKIQKTRIVALNFGRPPFHHPTC